MHEAAEGAGSPATQPVDEHSGLLAHTHGGRVDVAQVDSRLVRPGLHRARCQQGELVRADPQHQLRQQGGQVRLEADLPRQAPGLLGQPSTDPGCHLLERPVLQEPREEQVPRLQHLQVLGVVDVGRRQQACGLEVEQGGRDHQELAEGAEPPRRVAVLGVPHGGDELVRDLGQGDLGDVQPVPGDQAEEQVERAREVVQVHLEATGARRCSDHPTRLLLRRHRRGPRALVRAGGTPPHPGGSARRS